MKGTWAVVLCSLFLIAAEIQGQLTSGKGRCSCTGKGSDFIQRKALEKIEVIPKSSSCDHVEIISWDNVAYHSAHRGPDSCYSDSDPSATMKSTGEQRCLNPNSKWVQKMVTALIKKRSSQSTHL